MGMCRDRGWNATSQQGPKTDTDHTGALPPPHAAHPADPARPDAGWRGTLRVITVCWVLVQAVSLGGTGQTSMRVNAPSRTGRLATAVRPATPLASAKQLMTCSVCTIRIYPLSNQSPTTEGGFQPVDHYQHHGFYSGTRLCPVCMNDRLAGHPRRNCQ